MEEIEAGPSLPYPITALIDATAPSCGWKIWGMSLVERQIRELARRGVDHFLVLLSEESERGVRDLRPDLSRLFDLQVVFARKPLKSEFGSSVVLLSGDTVYDDRILDHLIESGPGHVVRGKDSVAAHLYKGQLSRPAANDVWSDQALSTSIERIISVVDAVAESAVAESAVAESAVAESAVAGSAPEDLDEYVASLRLTMVPYMIRLVARDQLVSVDHLMYRRSFKGVIDAVALYGYYHLVRWATRRLSRTALAPNLATVGSMLAIWVAIPAFGFGFLGAGVGLAWIGVILDSVDGKLARLTVHLSDRMGDLEHATALPGLGLWYAALGWHFTNGELLDSSPMALTTWMLLISFLVDKVLSGSFKQAFGKELFDYSRVDAIFHLVACRRNIGLLLMTLGVAVGSAREGFALVGVWMVITMVFHGVRFAWIGIARVRPTRSAQ